MKTYVITLSKQFPTGHIRAGEPTNFKEQMHNAVLAEAGLSACDCCAYATRNCDTCGHKVENFRKKRHTIRDNYPLWAKRIAEVERGEACLSIRQWTGAPYRSKQVEIVRLAKEDGVGVQKLEFTYGQVIFPFVEQTTQKDGYIDLADLAANDGLSEKDFCDWFDPYNLAQPMAIIHFTPFRY